MEKYKIGEENVNYRIDKLIPILNKDVTRAMAQKLLEDGKILVVYFSQTGNTETVANFIHEAVGGDIIKLETEQTYTSDYNELLDVAQEERRNNARPALRTQINNIDEYHLHMKVEQFVERRRILNK